MWGWTQRVARPVVLALTTLAALVICCFHAAVAGSDTVPASGIGYLCVTAALFSCGVAFWTRTGSVQGALHFRWTLISAGAFAASIGYLPSFTEAIFHTGQARLLQTVCFNASEAFYMLAIVLFFAGVTRSIVIVDMLQALLFVVLRFNVIYSPVTFDHFTPAHLVIGQFLALFLFLVAVIACLGAASPAELTFLRTLSWFFGIRLLDFFLSNQVSYAWLHHINCGLWDVPGPILLFGFALYLLFTRHFAESEAPQTVPLRAPTAAVRSLMPSFLAFLNLILGLMTLIISVRLAAIAISASLVCYVLRNVLVQAQVAKEKTILQNRNHQLEGLATRDPLTGIGNRRSLAAAYNRLQLPAASPTLSLLLIDIDFFKQANDNHGHQHGDKVLVSLAKQLESLAAGFPGSRSVRMGGDEFAVLLLGVSPHQASSLAEALRFQFSAMAFEAGKGTVSLSIGIMSLQTARDLPLETLISCADRALYRAKLLGRNRVEAQPVWEPGSALDDPTALQARLALQRATS